MIEYTLDVDYVSDEDMEAIVGIGIGILGTLDNFEPEGENHIATLLFALSLQCRRYDEIDKDAMIRDVGKIFRSSPVWDYSEDKLEEILSLIQTAQTMAEDIQTAQPPSGQKH